MHAELTVILSQEQRYKWNDARFISCHHHHHQSDIYNAPITKWNKNV